MKVSTFLSFVLTLFSFPALSQVKAVSADSAILVRYQVNASYVQLYKENAELSYTSPGGEIGAPAKYVINGKLTTTYMLLGTERLPVAFAVIPDFTVRVRNEESAGVRTPSFRLGGALYVRISKSDEDYKYATLSFTHHSNGQDEEAIHPDGSINTRTGNFSTNYLTLKYHFGSRSNLSKGVYYSLNHDAGLEWHRWFSYEKALENDYGFSRLIYDFSLRRYLAEKENWRLNTAVSYAINPMSEYRIAALKKRLNAEVAFHYAFPFMSNAFVMAAAGYYGEDPYNIYYRDRYSYLRFGISSGFLRGKNKSR